MSKRIIEEIDMKKLFIALTAIIFVTACATVPIQNPVCPQEGSWICERSAQLGIQPEQLYGWIYDAAVVAAVTDVVKIQELCEFEQKLADWYISVYPMSHTALIGKVISSVTSYDDQKMALIASVLNRNLLQYRSTELISPADDLIFKKGHKAFRRDMLCDY
jgi:uncharacterized lipoprotein YajG